MNDVTTAPSAITPESKQWPEFAPVWAARAVLDEGERAMTFEREWSLPSMYRDAEPLVVVSVCQEFNDHATRGAFVPGEPWVAAGPPAMWADYRREEIAATLRAIAEALVPRETTTGAQLGAGERTP